MKETFGEFIKKLRTENGFTLTQLGAKINIDSGALSKIENGKKRLDEKTLPKLAKIFKLNLEEIRDEFFSERIAYEIYENKCSEKVLQLAEQKIKFIRTKNTKQGSLGFN
ncbi:MAG: helix-turn-helix transcriptional regulator [Bacteroidota bacterium]|nr:helix-turn-helix transcriptional regulator [Bacteroidota bacterium]